MNTTQPYETAAAFARRLDPPVTRQAVTDWCRAGLIPGAYQTEAGGFWFVPTGSKRPELRIGRPIVKLASLVETEAANA